MAYVLIAEGEQTLAFFIKQILLEKDATLQVDWVASGTEALKRLRETAYDLLITDLYVPGLSGLSLIEDGRGFQPHLSSILITGFTSPAIEKRVTDMGINAYLAKPFRAEELTGHVDDILTNLYRKQSVS